MRQQYIPFNTQMTVDTYKTLVSNTGHLYLVTDNEVRRMDSEATT
jgi:hypothetical protein